MGRVLGIAPAHAGHRGSDGDIAAALALPDHDARVGVAHLVLVGLDVGNEGLEIAGREVLPGHQGHGNLVDEPHGLEVERTGAAVALPFQDQQEHLHDRVALWGRVRAQGLDAIDAVAQDGIQLKAKARVTVRTNIKRLVGGATEETIIARVGEGIVSTIGSAETHKDVLENPGAYRLPALTANPIKQVQAMADGARRMRLMVSGSAAARRMPRTRSAPPSSPRSTSNNSRYRIIAAA